MNWTMDQYIKKLISSTERVSQPFKTSICSCLPYAFSQTDDSRLCKLNNKVVNAIFLWGRHKTVPLACVHVNGVCVSNEFASLKASINLPLNKKNGY